MFKSDRQIQQNYADSDCQSFQFCDAGFCTDFGIGLLVPDDFEIEPECTEDIECGDAGFCNDEFICEAYPIVGPSGENPLCTANSDCQSFQFCDAGFCTV